VVVGCSIPDVFAQRPLGDWRLFTINTISSAQVIIATPLVVGVTMSSVAGIDPALRPQCARWGNPWRHWTNFGAQLASSWHRGRLVHHLRGRPSCWWGTSKDALGLTRDYAETPRAGLWCAGPGNHFGC